MCRKFVLFCALVLALSISEPSWSTIIYDDFNTPHDYLADGVGGTVWDGFVGLGEGENATAINADINEPNSLHLGSIGSFWEPPFNPLGPFLYKNIQSDNWIVMTRVSAYPEGVYWNLFGIMARASMDPDEAGEGEDSEQLGHFEVTHATNVRSIGNGDILVDLSMGMLAPYLRLRQVTEVNELGDVNTVIYHEVSLDGKEWTLHPQSPSLRNDFTGLTLQLGMHHATYTEYSVGWGAYGETTILYRGEGQAWYESPGYNASEVDLKPTLSWSPGPYVKSVQGHEVYLSDDISKVEGRDVSVKVITDTNSYPITSSLGLDTVYYWCVDEVNDTCAPGEWEGDVWNFSTNAGKAFDPIPYDRQDRVSVEIVELQWTPSKYAVTQNFYFGEDEETVANSTTPLVSDIPNDINYIDLANEGIVLETDKTYYWRIESVYGAPGTSKGDVWEFKTWYPYMLCDDFEDWDWWIPPFESTIWDGIVGIEYLIDIGTDINDGHLTIESMNGYWAGNNHGVLLYTDIAGDFAATVVITDILGLYVDRGNAVATNNAGIMARVSDLDLAGPGEDWISIDYFPGWGVGNIIRHCDDGFRYELGAEMTGWAANRYLQMERYGNTFHLSRSPNGSTYTPSLESPVERADMDGLPLQVGLHHCTFGPAAAWAEYDDFCVARNAIEKAYAPNPSGGGYLDLLIGILSWTKGDFAVEHRVYFSSDFNDVNNRVEDANRGTDRVEYEGDDRFSYDAGYYESLATGQDYYWCIDEIGDVDPCLWPGDVWRFEVQDYSPIDNFESYSGTGKSAVPPAGTLKSVWVDGNFAFKLFPSNPGTSGSLIQLSEDIAQSGSKSMKFYYDNDGYVTWETDLYNCYAGPGEPNPCNYTPFPDTYLSEVYAAIDDAWADSGLDSLDLKRDWSSYKVLKLSFYGDPNNDIEPMYAGLEDGSGNLAVIYHPDSSCIINNLWQDWHIALQDFADVNDVNLTDVVRIYLGFGNKYNQQPGGTGLIFVDDIQLLAYSVCAPEYGEPAGDLNGDCNVNYDDLKIMAEEWLTAGIKADIIDNDNVDWIDFTVLADDWLKEELLGD